MADMKPDEIIRLTQLLSEFNEILKQSQAAYDNLTDAAKQSAEGLAKIAEIEEAQLKRAAALIEFAKLGDEQKTAANQKLQQQIDSSEKLIQANQTVIQKEQEIADKINKKIEAGKNVGSEERQRMAESVLKVEELKQKTDSLKESRDKQLEQQKLLNETFKEAEIEQAKELLRLNDLKKATDSLTASLSEHMRNKAGINRGYVDFINVTGKAGGVTGMMNSLIQSQAASFKEVLNPINLVSSAISYAIENFQQFYNTLAKVGREAGTTVASGFNAAYASGARLGIDMGAQVATANALANSFVNLGNKEREQTTELLIASYQMQRFGIGAAESVTILSGFQRSLGLSAEQSAKLATELVSTARSFGLTSDAVKGLANNMEQFIAYGSKANEVMKETLEVSSKFGIGTDAIAKMSTKLDTLEGSITAANTVARELGVALDPIQLLRANPAEKMQMVADAIARSGFEGENARFKIQVLGDSLGLTAAQIQLLTKQTEQSGNELAFFEKGIRDLEASLGKIGGSLDGLEQVKIFFQNIGAPLMTFLGLINGFLGVIFSLINALIGWVDAQTVVGGWILKLILFLGLAKVAIGGFGGMVSWVTGIIGTGLSRALAATGAGFSSMITSMGTAAAASAAGVGPLLAFGFAILMIGVGIGAAALGMSKFVAAFKGFGAGEIFAIAVAIFALGYSIAGIITALGATAANPLGAIGIAALLLVAGAFLLIGAGVKMAADGLKTFGDAASKTGLTQFVSALKELALLDIDIPTLKIKTVYETLAGGSTAIAKEKILAMADMTQNLQVYSQAVKTFEEAGGATAAQVMTEKFVESMTTISDKVTTTQLAAVPASSSPFGSGGVIQIHVNDAIVFRSYISQCIIDDTASKTTGGG